MKTHSLLITILLFITSSIYAQSLEAVDLGLSVKWADCNIGATKPEASGYYFTWEETSRLGNNWRTPTEQEWAELINYCSWTWSSRRGINGYIVIGPNGGTIFLPAAGFLCRSEVLCMGSDGYYWTSSLKSSNPECAVYGYFHSSSVFLGFGDRSFGYPIRPVFEENPY